MSNIAQRSFSGGELAPALYARTDVAKYQSGLRTCRNFMVMKHGGLTNRPGTELVVEVKDSTKTVRFVKFVFNADQTYVLEVGDLYMRIVRDGGQITVSGVSAWVDATAYALGDLVSRSGVNYTCTLAHTSAAATDEPAVGTQWQSNWYALTGSVYEIPTPYLEADLPDIQFVQSADVITLVHPSYPVYELRRYAHTRWTLVPITFGPDTAKPTGLGLAGGTAFTVYYAVTAVDGATGEESLAAVITAANRLPASGTPTVVTWALVAGALSYNVYRSLDGITFGLVGTVGGTAGGLPTSDTTWTTATANVSTNTLSEWVAAATQVRDPTVAAAADKALDGAYQFAGQITVGAAASPDNPIVTSGRIHAYYSRDGEARQDAGIIVTGHNLGGIGQLGPVDVSGTVQVPDNGYTTLTIDLVPEVMAQLFDGPGVAVECTVDGTSISWNKGGSTFSDDDVAPDYTRVPPTQVATFDAPDRYPSAVTYYQQRRIFGNTNAEPEKVLASATGHYQNFSRSSPLQDDDAVVFTIAGRQVNAVKHLIDLGKLLVLTSGGENIVDGDSNGVLTPSGVNIRQYSYNGIGRLPPLPVDTTLLYVQARGTIVRDLSGNTIDGLTGSDLTVWSSHLFRGYTIVDWDFALNPDGIVWAVRSDGTLLGLSFMREQQVLGWHRHDTDGVVENVCVVPEGSEDRVYLLVKRTIDGETKRYIERMASRFFTDVRDAYFVDCGLSYDGRNTGATTMTLSGGTEWDESETLTITASAGFFTADDVGNAIVFTDADGDEIRVMIEEYTSTTVVTGRAVETVPAELRSIATATWSRAVETFSGLDHLEGKDVAVLGDGFVVASPNNEDYDTVTVSGGSVTFDEPYSVVHVGLPYLSDMETLDIDTASGPSLKEKKGLVNKVGLFVEASRGIWAGRQAPSDDDDDPLEGLQELKIRDGEEYDDATDLTTGDINILIERNWDSNGRVFVRQVDPLPLSILSVTPTGLIP